MFIKIPSRIMGQMAKTWKNHLLVEKLLLQRQFYLGFKFLTQNARKRQGWIYIPMYGYILICMQILE